VFGGTVHVPPGAALAEQIVGDFAGELLVATAHGQVRITFPSSGELPQRCSSPRVVIPHLVDRLTMAFCVLMPDSILASLMLALQRPRGGSSIRAAPQDGRHQKWAPAGGH
jgi:hypothetical protein